MPAAARWFHRIVLAFTLGTDNLQRDLRGALRILGKSPGFTAIAVISIAFGTGANVAVFSAADALLFRPLPVVRPSELLTVGTKTVRGFVTLTVTSHADYLDIRERATSFDGLTAYVFRRVGLSTGPAAPPRVKVATLTAANFFQVLKVDLHLGRGFRPDEDAVPGRDAVAVLSYGTWRDDFNADPSVLGRTFRMAGIDFTVIGVAPESFTGMEPRLFREAAYVPLAMWTRILNHPLIDPLTARDFRNLTVKGRLKPEVSPAAARAELDAIARDLERAHPDTNTRQGLTTQTELEVRLERAPLDSALMLVLTVLSVSVLCVACANVAGLLTSRAPVRAREIALRLAIGASRARIMRQLIIESLLIALAGGTGGLAVGYAGIHVLRQIEIPTDFAAFPPMRLDERALWFSLAVAVTSAFLFGLVPALQTTRVDLVRSLRVSEPGGGSRRMTGRSVLVTLQVALSLVLLTMALFTYRFFEQEIRRGPGFRTTRLAKISFDAGEARYSPAQAASLVERALDDARRLPGAGPATATSVMPMFGFELASIVPEGFTLPEGQKSVRPYASSVDEAFFETLEVDILDGRSFRSTDDAGAARVAIVNDTLARRYWPGESAVGKRFKRIEAPDDWVEIVGVCETVTSLYPGERPQGTLYFPYRQVPRASMVMLVQTRGPSASLLDPLRALMKSIDEDIPVFDVQTIEYFYAGQVTTLGNVCIRLIGGMGIMGLVLTTVGLYGLVSYATARRTREIGVRIAIGATQSRVLRMILWQGLAPACFGTAIGLVLSGISLRLMIRAVQIEAQVDSRLFVFAVPALFIVAAVASLIPARRAARINPTAALRCE